MSPRFPRAGRSLRGAAVAAALTVVITPTAVLTAAAPTAADPFPFTVKGIDLASWQHPGGAPIDWAKVSNAGYSFAIVKATEATTYTNPYYAGDRRDAQRHGLVVGAYHFARPQLPLKTANQQARYFVRVAGNQQLSRTLPPVLDLEQTGGLTRSQLAKWSKRWLDTVQSLTGRTPMLYSYDAFLRANLGKLKDFSGYPLWYANYRSTVPTDIPGGWGSFKIWQHSSSTRVPGIEGRTDTNWFNGSHSQLLSFGTGRVPVSLAQTRVQRHQRTYLTGRVDPAYAGAQVIRRERKKNGNWTTRKTKRVRADGSYSFAVRPGSKRDRQYRVRLHSNEPFARVRSVTARLAVDTPWVKASVAQHKPRSLRKLQRGSSARITGRVDKFYAGKRIVRQKLKANGRWVNQKRKRVKANGRFTFRVKPKARTTHRYRIVLRSNKPKVDVASRTLKVRVR